jgi:hypothetical protein
MCRLIKAELLLAELREERYRNVTIGGQDPIMASWTVRPIPQETRTRLAWPNRRRIQRRHRRLLSRGARAVGNAREAKLGRNRFRERGPLSREILIRYAQFLIFGGHGELFRNVCHLTALLSPLQRGNA